jgi:hypothetical protein
MLTKKLLIMTPDQLIETLKQFVNEAERIKVEGSNEYSDFSSLIDDICDTFKYVEIEN